MDTFMQRILPSTTEQIEACFDLFDEELTQIQGQETERELFLLNFVEALTNAAEHGNRWSANKRVYVETFTDSHFSIVFIRDEGSGYRPKFVKLEEVSHNRGRGLGMIRAHSDAVYFSHQGREIVFWKRFTKEVSMYRENDNASYEYSLIGDQGILINKFTIKQNGLLNHALTEFFAEQKLPDVNFILFDCSKVRVLSSLSWGVIIEFLQSYSKIYLILFNASMAVVQTAKTLGLYEPGGPYRNLKILERATA